MTVTGFGKLAPTMIAPLASSSFTTSCVCPGAPAGNVDGLSTTLTVFATGTKFGVVAVVIGTFVVPAPAVTTTEPVESGVPVPSDDAYVVTVYVSAPMNPGTATEQTVPPELGVQPELTTSSADGAGLGGGAPFHDCSVNRIDFVPLEM
ncbi:MAG: hypothetical protein JO164_12705 [Candidatus Eremiobacteraeota bacterium]|nr:hypothetical protein [Candidatus Eremiobacteraeota bacterium]